MLSGAVGTVSGEAGKALMEAATSPIGTPLPVTDETYTAGVRPDEALGTQEEPSDKAGAADKPGPVSEPWPLPTRSSFSPTDALSPRAFSHWGLTEPGEGAINGGLPSGKADLFQPGPRPFHPTSINQ